jgi:PEGA domain-containing protein
MPLRMSDVEVNVYEWRFQRGDGSRVKGIVSPRRSKTSPWLTSTTQHHGTNRSRTQFVEWALLQCVRGQTCSVNQPSAVSCTYLHTMQPSMRQFSLDERGQTSRSSGQLDPLLEFDSEDCIVGRRELAAVSVRHPWPSPSSFRSEAVGRPPREIEARPAARSKAGRSVWPVVVGATFGSLAVAVMVMQISLPSRMALQSPVASPPPALALVRTGAPVEIPPVAPPVVPVTPAGEKKPSATVPVKPRTPVVDAPVEPQSTASRPVARARFYGSLTIESGPVSARVFINGEAVGVTPLALTEVPVGSRAVRLEADDHNSWSSTVRVVAGQETRVSATLNPSR